MVFPPGLDAFIGIFDEKDTGRAAGGKRRLLRFHGKTARNKPLAVRLRGVGRRAECFNCRKP
jgi:hypothetical protein